MVVSIFIMSLLNLGTVNNTRAMLSYNPFNLEYNRYSLQGDRYLIKVNRDAYELIQWINSNIEGTPSILEAVGANYDYASSLIGTYTGLPTYLGWPHHVTHRGTDNLKVQKKTKLIENIYNTQNLRYAHFILKKEGISFVVISQREWQLYDNTGILKFIRDSEKFKIVYQKNKTYLVKVLP